jgi:ribosome recycling factor
MSDSIEMGLELAKESMDHAVEHLAAELSKIRTGKASPGMLRGLKVDYYGSPTELTQVANVGASDGKTLTIQPWEKSIVGAIEKAIFEANLGLTPQNNGEMIIINIPPLTEERRKDFVKLAKALAEDAKVSIRNSRHKILETIKSEVKEGFPEDAGKREEENVQKRVNGYSEKINALVAAKEKDIMKV